MNPNSGNGYMFMSYNRTDTASPCNLSSTLPVSPLTSPLPPSNTTPNFRKQTSLDRSRLTGNNYMDIPIPMEGITPVGNDSTDGICSSPVSTIPRRELKKMKEFGKELLVNKSPTVHSNRKAEYIDIDLPDTSTSDDNSSIDSANSTIYDIPTNRQSHYDVPTPSKEQTNDKPKGMNRSTSTSSTTSNPISRPLPHLPTDYVNVILSGPARTLPTPGKGSGYVNIGCHPQKPVIEKTEMGMYVDVERIQSKSATNLYKDIPERIESQLTIRKVESDRSPMPTPGVGVTGRSSSTSPTPVSKTALELAEEGYELINPATLPALVNSPIPSSTVSTSSMDTLEEDDEDDEYISVTRSSTLLPTLIRAPSGKKSSDSSDTDGEFFQVRSRSKRASDGYEEIQDVIKELMRGGSGNKDTLQLTTTNPATSSRSLSDSEVSNGRTSSSAMISTSGSVDATPLADVFVSNSSTPLPISRQSSDGSTEHNISNSTLEGESQMELTQHNDSSTINESDMGFSQDSTCSTSQTDNNKVIINSEVEEYRPEPTGGSHDNDYEGVPNISMSEIEDQKVRSTSDPAVPIMPPPPKGAPINISRGSVLVPTAAGSPVESEHAFLIRKRSSTLGDILDTKEPKKHTYVNVPDDTHAHTGSMKSLTGGTVINDQVPKKKPPKPLPRPPSIKSNLPRQTSVVDPCINGNNSNNKVKTLVRQFSDC